MYWWNQAAHLLRQGKIERFGLITTKTITQKYNGRVVQEHLGNDLPAYLVFQNPAGVRGEIQVALPGTGIPEEEEAAAPAVIPWPKGLPEQVSAVRSLLGNRTWDLEQVARRFKGARRKEVESVLDSLAALGLAVAFDTPEGRRWRGVERAVAV